MNRTGTDNTAPSSLPLREVDPAWRAITDFAEHAAASTTRSSILSALTDAALAITQASRSMAVTRGRDGVISVNASRGLSPAFRSWVEAGVPGIKCRWFDGARFICADVMNDDLMSGGRAQFLAEGIRGLITMPISDGEPRFPALALAYDRPTTEGPETFAKLAALTAVASAHISRAHAEQDAQWIAKVIEDTGGVAFERIKGETWCYRRVSPALAEFLGRSLEDLESGRVSAIAAKHPDDVDRCAFEIARCVASSSDRLSTDYRIIKGDGETVAVRESIRITEMDSARGATRVVGVLWRAEPSEAEPLSEDAMEIEPILMRFPMGALDMDSSGTILRANPALTAMLGMGEGWLDGSTIESVLHPDDVARHQAAMSEAARGTAPAFRQNQRWRRRDGSFITVLLCACSATPKRGGGPILRCTVSDREDPTLMHERIKAAEETLRGFVEQDSVGVAEIGADGRVAMANQRLCDILGYRSKELLGMDWRKLSHPADVARCEDRIAELAAGIRSTFSVRKRYIRQDGVTISAQVAITAGRDVKGQVARFIVILQLLEDQQTARPEIAPIAEAPAATPRAAEMFVGKVLIIDDEPAVRATISAMLGEEGIVSMSAADATEAWAALNAEGKSVKVVVCDEGLADGDGISLAREIATKMPGIRVLLMSGSHRGESEPNRPALRKPFGVEALTQAVLYSKGI